MTLVFAMILDAVFGEPKAIWSRIPHPAVLMGKSVGFLDLHLNTGKNRKLRGVLATIALVISGIGIALFIQSLGTLAVILTTAILLAQRSLCDHLKSVANDLRLDLRAGRRAVSMIVGRDTADMASDDVVRSAIESGAENLSDGIIAPLFWFVVAGLPGLIVYKFVNTADSMIGYKTPKYVEFGWAAARLDDVLNFIPARLSAVFILIAGLRPQEIFKLGPDARLHRSINAGWPEAAMAHVLGVALSGPRSYHGELRDFPWVNETGNRKPGPKDIDRCIPILWRVWMIVFALVLGGVCIFACP